MKDFTSVPNDALEALRLNPDAGWLYVNLLRVCNYETGQINGTSAKELSVNLFGGRISHDRVNKSLICLERCGLVTFQGRIKGYKSRYQITLTNFVNRRRTGPNKGENMNPHPIVTLYSVGNEDDRNAGCDAVERHIDAGCDAEERNKYQEEKPRNISQDNYQEKLSAGVSERVTRESSEVRSQAQSDKVQEAIPRNAGERHDTAECAVPVSPEQRLRGLRSREASLISALKGWESETADVFVQMRAQKESQLAHVRRQIADLEVIQ